MAATTFALTLLLPVLTFVLVGAHRARRAARGGARAAAPELSPVDVAALSEADVAALKRSLAGVLWGASAVDWLRLVQASHVRGLELEVLAVREPGAAALRGLVVVSHYRFDCGEFLPDLLKRALGPLAQSELLRFRLAFVEVPFMFVSGLLVPADTSDEERAELLLAVRARLARGARRPHLVAFYRGVSLAQLDAPGEIAPAGDSALAERLEAEGFFRLVPFTHAVLDLRGTTSFDDFVKKLPQTQWRTKVRRQSRELLGRGGRLERAASIGPVADVIYDLYDRTRAKNRAKGGLDFPGEIVPDVFRNMDAHLPAAARRCVIARAASGAAMGFVLNFVEGGYAICKFIGQDYEASQESFAYFNLLYETVRIAIEDRCAVLNLGPGAWDAKYRFGARRFEVPLYAAATGPAVELVLRLVKDRVRAD